MTKQLFLPLFLVFAFSINFTYSQGDKIVDVTPLDFEINFDGKMDENGWQSMSQFTTVQNTPYNGQAISEAEEIHICYDSKYLYIAATIQGDDIRSPSKRRDEFTLRPDYLGIMLDSYNDHENALGFFTTPSATRSDFTVFEDAVGSYPINLDWNTYWDVKTSRSEKSWDVEIRIPFTSLQFQDTDGLVEMGLIIWRATASKNEVSTWPHIRNDYGDWSSFKPSQSKLIRLKNITSTRPVYVTPYVLLGGNRLVSEDEPFSIDYNNQLSAGVDVKYSLTSNITLDLTLNTDFAQVEADDAQVNLDRFDLFFPEKRQFFQERSAIFDLRIGGPNRVFYSRRIGIDDNGRLEKIMGGVRLTGRVGDYDIGVINMATRNDNWSLKNNFSVLRVRKKVLNSNSYIGFIGTNKTNFNGDFNSVYAIDGTFRLKRNHLFQMRLAQSFTEGLENKPLSLSPTKLFINLEKVQFSGFTYDLALTRMGKNYNPEMGFEERGNYSSAFAILGFGWQSAPESKILQQQIKMYNFAFFNNTTGLDETMNSGLEYTVSSKSGHNANAFSYLRRERLFSDVNIINEFTVAKGLYDINVWAIGYNMPNANLLRYSVNLRGGDIFDSKFLALRQSIEWVVFPDLSLEAFYNYNPIFRDSWSGDIINIHLARLKFFYTLSTKLSFSGFIQATSNGDLGLGNIRFRYNPREGVDLFIVYNNITNLEQAFVENNYRRAIPEQVLVAKFTYTFRL